MAGTYYVFGTFLMLIIHLIVWFKLMGWFNAGTDEKTESPDLLGCVELPAPWQVMAIHVLYTNQGLAEYELI